LVGFSDTLTLDSRLVHEESHADRAGRPAHDEGDGERDPEHGARRTEGLLLPFLVVGIARLGAWSFLVAEGLLRLGHHALELFGGEDSRAFLLAHRSAMSGFVGPAIVVDADPERELADLDDVILGDVGPLERPRVEQRAVGAAQIDGLEAAVRSALDPQVFARDAGVVEEDIAIGTAPDHHRDLAEHVALERAAFERKSHPQNLAFFLRAGLPLRRPQSLILPPEKSA
jgi:hypothetical protein